MPNVGVGTGAPVDVFSLGTTPQASATHALLNVSNTALVAASASGTYIGANPAAASADFINYQVAGATQFKVDKNGVITGNGSGLTGIAGGNLGSSTAAASPQVSGDATTGLYTAGAGKVDVSIVGNKIVEFNASGEAVTANSTSPASAFSVTQSGSGYAGTFMGGNVGMGTSNPGARLEIDGASGTTLKIVDTNQGPGKVLTSDAAGNASWQSVAGTGTVNAGTTNQMAWYTGNGTAVSGLTTANNGVLVTGGTGIPSISSTLPAVNGAAVTNLNGSAVTSGMLPTTYGGTGVNGSAAANGSLLIGNGTGYTLATLTAGTGITIGNAAGAITISNAGGASPVGAALASTDIWVGSAGGVAAQVAVTGDATISNTGVTTVAKVNGVAFPASASAPINTVPVVTAANTSVTYETVPVAAGGTGAVTLTTNGILMGNGTGAVTAIGPVAAGQVLTSQGVGSAPVWAAPGAAASVALSGLTNASGTATLANANFAQVWNWDTLTTGTGMTMASASMTSGSVLALSDSFNSASSTGSVLSATVSGASSAAIPVSITNGGTGTSLTVTNSGGGYAATLMGGNVGIGTTAPAKKLHVVTPGTLDDGLLFETSGGTLGPYVSLKNGGAGGREYNIFSTGSGNGPGAGKLEFFDRTASATRMVIDSVGHVGIGVVGAVSPVAQLEIDSSGNAVIAESIKAPATPSTNIWQVTNNAGTAQVYVDSSFKLHGDGSLLTGLGTLGTAAGTSSPSISGDTTTGLYTAGAGLVDVSVSGTKRAEFSSTNISLYPAAASSLIVNGSEQVAGGQIYANENGQAAGATVDFNTGNVQTLLAPGTSVITTNNMKSGAAYSVVIMDVTTPRAYTFSGCTTAKYVPANGTTIGPVVYSILFINDAATMGGANYCLISWVNGFQ